MAKKDNETVENTEAVTTDTKVTPDETNAPEVKVAPEESEPSVESTEPEPAPTRKVSKKIKKLADEVDRGVYGSGRERMILLGDNYEEVQAEMNHRYRDRLK